MCSIVILAAVVPAAAEEAGSRTVRTPWQEYTPSPNGRALRIWWCTNSAYGLKRVRVREGRRRVVITVLHRAPNGPTTQAALCRGKRVRLRAPLGTRRVIDGATGKRRHAGAGFGS